MLYDKTKMKLVIDLKKTMPNKSMHYFEDCIEFSQTKTNFYSIHFFVFLQCMKNNSLYFISFKKIHQINEICNYLFSFNALNQT